MSEPLFIFGTGGHARDVAELVAALDRRPVFVTRDARERDGWTGSDEIVLEQEVVSRDTLDFAIGIGENRARARIADAYAGLCYPALVHPDTSFGRAQRTFIEEAPGTVVFAGARFTARTRVGAFCTFNLNTTVSHDCAIDDFVNLSPGANVAGHVHIGRGAWIGVGAAINQGSDLQPLRIGADTIIGSGAVVLTDCDPDSTYVGVPARKIR